MKNIFDRVAEFFGRPFSRRRFLKLTFLSAVASVITGGFPKKTFATGNISNGRPKKNISTAHDIVLCEGKDPYTNTAKVVNELGGMGRFVKKGDVVVIKPNMAWDRTPEQAANTDPGVISALVSMAYAEGAKKVKVFDVCCNDTKRCYERSGIKSAAQGKGAQVLFPDDWNVVKARFNYKSSMEDWAILRDAVECDTFINVPVLKHHRLARLTLSMKNLMGVCTGNRGLMHLNLGNNLVDITDFMSPDLTIIDAHRFLERNGPSGGDLADVVVMNKVFAGTDPTLMDIFACELVNVNPVEVPNVKVAMDRKFGRTTTKGADIFKVNL